jgi:hypothetical protein
MTKQNKDIDYEFKIYPEYNGHEASEISERPVAGIFEENTGIRQRRIPDNEVIVASSDQAKQKPIGEIKVQEASEVSFKQQPKASVASSDQREEEIEKISELKSGTERSDLIPKGGGQNEKQKGFLSESESKPSFFLKALFTTLLGVTLLRVAA